MQGHLISPILQRCLSCDQMLPRHDGAHLPGAELNWHSLNECFRRDHVLRCIYIFYEVCRIDMCVVCNLIGINLKESKSPSGNDIAFPKTRLLSSFIFGLFSRTSAVTTTPWRILSTAMSCYNSDFRRNSRTKTFFFP